MGFRVPVGFLSAVLLAASLGSTGCAPTYGTYAYGTGVAAPPPLYAPAPQDLVVLPGTNVYAAPSFSAGLYFVDGWWWRPWNGRWYRTSRYGSDWRYFSGTPSFTRSIPRDWRNDYYRRQWQGHPWDYHRVSRDEAVANWDRWKRERRWSWDRSRDDGSRDRRDRGDRYRYDDQDFRREPVRYERDRSQRDDRRDRDYSREAEHRWERRPQSPQQGTAVIRRTGSPVQQQQPGRGVRSAHDRARDRDRDGQPDAGYEDWRRR